MNTNTKNKSHIRIACRTIDDIFATLGLEFVQPDAVEIDHGPEEWGIESQALQALCALVDEVQPSMVVELGTYKGRTAAVLGQRLKTIGHGTLVTIDDFRSIDRSFCLDRFSNGGLDDVVVQLDLSTRQAFAEWSREKIDLLIIDASHDFLSTCIDFSLWSRLVSPRGWIVMHDTQSRLLRRFPDDYIYPLSHYHILDVIDLEDRSATQRWEGIAFIRRKESEWSRNLTPHAEFVVGSANWAGALF